MDPATSLRWTRHGDKWYNALKDCQDYFAGLAFQAKHMQKIMTVSASRVPKRQPPVLAADRLILNELRDRILTDLPGHVRRIVLFGSRARGDFDAASDLDVLVVLDECDAATLDRVRTARYEVMWRWQFEPLISLLLLSEQEWQELSRHSAGLKVNIEREGMTVWPTM